MISNTVYLPVPLDKTRKKGRHLAHVGVHHLDTRAACTITLVSGEVLGWAAPAWEQPALLCVNYSLFTAGVMEVSDHPVSAREVTGTIWATCQGVRGAGDYAIVFHKLEAEGGWNEESLRGAIPSSRPLKSRDCR